MTGDHSSPRTAPSYLSKLTGHENDHVSFLASFEELNEVDWHTLAEDVLRQSPAAYDVFRPSHGHGLLEVAATYARQLSLRMRQRWAGGVEALIATNKRKADQEKAQKLLSHALYFAGVLQDAFSRAVLFDLIRDANFSDEIRLKAARALANQGETVPVGYWVELDLTGFPAMAPAFLSALAPRQPVLALERLRQLSMRPTDSSILEYPLRITLRALLNRSHGEEYLVRLLKGAPDWLTELLWEILDLAEFEFARDSIRQHLASIPFAVGELDAVVGMLEKYCLEEVTVPPWEMNASLAQSLGVPWREDWSASDPVFAKAYQRLVEEWQRRTVEHDSFSQKLRTLAQFLDPAGAESISGFEDLLREDAEFSVAFSEFVDDVGRQSREQEYEDAEYEAALR